MKDPLEELQQRHQQAEQGGGPERIKDQHAKGKMTARERVAYLMDEGSFQELGALMMHQSDEFGMGDKRFAGDGVVTGFGTINGRRAAVFAQDFTVLGGSFSEVQSSKVCRLMELAEENGVPVIGLLDSGGARIQEGVRSLDGYGKLFRHNVRASGVVPQISVQMGPCAGGGVYSPALTDFIVMVRQTGFMFITGPEVIKAVTGEQVDFESLGGANVHGARSGVAHLDAPDDCGALELVKQLLSYLPQNNSENPPAVEPTDDPNRREKSLNTIIPESSKQAYDIKEVIEAVFDQATFLEVQPLYAPNAVIGFARLDGRAVGVVANQPAYLAGVLDIDAGDKISRFVRICDAYNLPIVTFVDTPGFLPGVAQEHGGIIRHGAKVIFAYCEATVPKVSVITRKAVGGAYISMSSKSLGADLAFAWPTSEITVMGPEGAVNILYRGEISRAEDPQARRQELLDAYTARFHTPYLPAELGYVDEVIEPATTRPRLIAALKFLRSKTQDNPLKKHGIMPV